MPEPVLPIAPKIAWFLFKASAIPMTLPISSEPYRFVKLAESMAPSPFRYGKKGSLLARSMPSMLIEAESPPSVIEAMALGTMSKRMSLPSIRFKSSVSMSREDALPSAASLEGRAPP